MTAHSSPPIALPDEATMAARIRTAPQVAAGGGTKRKVDEWLHDLGRSGTATRLRQLVAARPPVRGLIDGLAEGSPYLWDLASREPERLLAVLQAEPEHRFNALLAGTKAAVAAAQDESDVMCLLRRMKAEAALLIAIADIGGVWPLPRVTQALTTVADCGISFALRFLLTTASAQGKIKLPDAADPEAGCGYVVLAMGKMGGFELNYSSDVDLICLYDPECPALAAATEAAPFYIRLTRSLARLLQERTADGYVFRVDLRLRPDPGLTQIALSTSAALGYYESVGQNWERAAMIKARPCAGDCAAGDAFLRELSPFIWRKYLDYAAVADVQAMKRQIHSYRGHDEIAVEGHNIKLGRGGIREIEFFVQTQQLIAGGRHPQLRGRETLATLEALVAGGWISEEVRRDLHAAYCFLRGVEHRLQMVNDEQTHTLPVDPRELEALARFLGYPDRAAFAGELLHHLRIVQGHYASLFNETQQASGAPELVFPPQEHDRDTLDRLLAMGFKRPLEVSTTARRWLSRSYRSLRGDLAQAHLQELVPALLTHLARAEDPDAGVIALDRFFAGLHGGARLLALLRQNPDFVSLIALLLGTAPRLAEILGQHPQAMDALIDPAFFGALPGPEQLLALLDQSIGQARSYEDLLDRVRLFRQEQLFLIGTRILSGTISARQAGEAYASLAETLIRRVQAAVEERFVEAHGRLPGQHVAIVAMGKLGGREMTAGSDLDLILIYDFDPARPESDGARPLYGSQYFARLTQRLIGALTAPTTYGALYPVDMRLRPSGRSGPVATQLGSFESYQRDEAWTWEHMALTRARVISGDPALRARIEAAIRTVLCQRRDADVIAADVVEMRRAIAAEKGDADRWDLKFAAGGLVDLEFIAQYLQLVHAADHPEILDSATAGVFERAWRLGILSTREAETLRPAVRVYQDLTQILRLCLSGRFDPQASGVELLRLLARAADLPDFQTLDAHLIEVQERVRASFTRILGDAP
ncbi:MAG TPA: bifunctional [glutamine synthetase] adenylyltransferase/[glutamine synthetase]-adenylyl-L-tyrosine phosphorylase [Xanthobacteraceae bacterium]